MDGQFLSTNQNSVPASNKCQQIASARLLLKGERDQLAFRAFFQMSSSLYVYRNDLLAPYLTLPQGEKIQAECMSLLHPSPSPSDSLRCLD